MNLQYLVVGSRRWLLVLVTAMAVAISAAGVHALPSLTAGSVQISELACSGGCGDSGGGGG